MSRLLCVVLAAASVGISAAAPAQTYPAKPVRVISGFPGGSTADASMRLVTQKMGDAMGQPFVVEPNAVAAGVGAAQAVMRAAPDGYTLLYALPSMIMIPPFLIKDKPFDPLKDFTPITSVMDGPIGILVAPSFPPRTVKELIDYARANPGKLSYGTNGIGGTYHLEMELFKQQFGLDLVQVPYKGGLGAVNALAAGQVPIAYAPYGAAVSMIRAGKMRMLVVLDYKRYPDLPDIPAMGEEIPNYQRIPTGLNLYGPAGLPIAIARRLHAESVKAVNIAEVQAKLRAITYFGVGTPPDVLAAQQVKDYETIARAVKLAGLKPQ